MKALVMMAALATSSALLVPTVANAETVEVTASVSSVGLDLGKSADRAVLDRLLARAINRACEEKELRGADRYNMERLCIASMQPGGYVTQLALNLHAEKFRRA